MRAGALLNWTEAWSPAGISRLVALHLRGMSARATTKHMLVQGARPASGSEGGAGQGAQRRRKQEAQHALGVFQTETLPFTRWGHERRSSSLAPSTRENWRQRPAPAPSAACPAGTHLDEQKLVHILALRGAPVLALVAAPGHEIDTLRAGGGHSSSEQRASGTRSFERRSFLGG